MSHYDVILLRLASLNLITAFVCFYFRGFLCAPKLTFWTIKVQVSISLKTNRFFWELTVFQTILYWIHPTLLLTRLFHAPMSLSHPACLFYPSPSLHTLLLFLAQLTPRLWIYPSSKFRLSAKFWMSQGQKICFDLCHFLKNDVHIKCILCA